ncbi:MAG: hypothetical protein E7620_00265 [Ruminococcaceae bacterium]|nr:hypothetical protein [Oscillospiraceae bacterium]
MALQFRSELLTKTTRYSPALELPEFLVDREGNFDRERTIERLLSEEYGKLDTCGVSVSVAEEKLREPASYAGKCKKHIRYVFTLAKGERSASFPVDFYLPRGGENCPVVVSLDFAFNERHCYCPIEEIMEAGVAVARVLYTNVTSDDNDFENGIAPLLTDRRDPHSAGKLRIWAYAASLIGEHLLKEGYVTRERLYVAGHSRLGKTALLAAALDTNFAGVHSNNSGASGVSIAREKGGETVEIITRVFPFWFAPCFASYANRENEMPFDQHYLTALIAPRKLSVATAEEDTWADTEAQYLSLEAASVIYEKLGVMGLDPEVGLMTTGMSSDRGQIGLFMRSGTHYFSRDDWRFFLNFIQK